MTPEKHKPEDDEEIVEQRDNDAPPAEDLEDDELPY